MISLEWMKRILAERDVGQAKFFELFAKALPKPSFAPRPNRSSKHQASKKGAAHLVGKSKRIRKTAIASNHTRVVAARAKQQGISIDEYLRKWSA